MKSFVKSIYIFIYYSIIYRILKLFPLRQNKIIYISHYGNRFGCNPKNMFDYIQKSYKGYEHVIVLNNKQDQNEISGDRIKFVNFHSISFLMELATSKYWVVNTNLPPELKPKKDTIYFQTWHAAGAFKKFGLDLPDSRHIERQSWKKDTENWSTLICSSESVVDIYSQACGVKKEIIHPIGLPRNDIFFNESYVLNIQKQFKEKYNIPENKKIILYAPTYRDTFEENPIHLDFGSLKNTLENDYVFLLKLHPLVANQAKDIKDDHFIMNFSAHSDIQDLLLITDVLITDYSSVIFDFAITGKPIVFYSYDLEEYDKNMRGFYFSYKEWVPGPIVYSQTELESSLKNYEFLLDEYHEQVVKFAKEYNVMNGDATKRAVELLLYHNKSERKS